jgi:hypothetical protein
MMRSTWEATVFAVCVLLTATAPAGGQEALLAKPDGSHAVGYWRTTLETGPPDQPGSRTLLIECWYPSTTPAPGAATKPYTSPAVERALADQLGMPADWAHGIETHAVPGATPLAGPFPVVIFSHGLSWPVALYQSLLEDVASRGFVVVGINHPGGTVIDYGGGRVRAFEQVPDLPGDSARDAFLARLTGTWEANIRRVREQLPRWNVDSAGGPLTGHLDLGRIALLGHSLGASASAQLAREPGADAVVVMEGRLRDSTARYVTVRAPFLHLIGEYNRLELENRNYRPSEGAPVYQAVVAGTGHAYFSDLIAIYRPIAPPAWRARHRYELEPGRIIQITRDYVAAFLDRYLLGVDSVLLHPVSYAARVDNPRVGGYPEVSLTIDVP